MLLISIIIPVYNVGNYLEKTLSSLLRQNTNNIEIIIINDGSTDNTLEIINSYIKKKCFKNLVVITTENKGVSSARNLGLSLSKSRYVYFLDGDDYISDDFLEVVFKWIDYGYDMISWGFDIVSEEQIISPYFDLYERFSGELSQKEVLNRILTHYRTLWICTISVLYKREFILKHNLTFDKDTMYGEDLEFIFKALLKVDGIFVIDKILSYYFQRPGSAMTKTNIRKFDAIISFLKILDSFIFNNKNDELNQSIHYLSTFYIPDNFMYYFYYFMNQYSLENKVSKFKSSRIVFKDISNSYPSLRKRVNKLMNKSIKNLNAFGLEVILFLINPVFAEKFRSNREIKEK